MSWDPNQYERFRDERAQPFYDLVELIQKRPTMRVVDLGCGTGELTSELHRRLGAAETIGVDNSASMLAKSSAFAGNGLRFEQGDIATFGSDRPFDLVFSNAAVHWVDDHESLFARLAALLTRNGQLAIQMPANHDHVSHVIAREIAPSYGVQPRATSVLPPERYAAILHRLGFTRQHVRLQVYPHVLPSSRDVVEWTKGTTLTPYREALPDDRYESFLAEYTARVIAALGDDQPFFYPFKRIHISAAR